MEKVETAPYNETRRMQLRGLVRLSSEIIAHYWPMRTFIHHNPLHHLESLDFKEALKQGQQLLGGEGYLSNRIFREYFRTGRILPENVDAVLKPLAQDKYVTLGNRQLTHFEVLRAHLLNEISPPAAETLEAFLKNSPDRLSLEALTEQLGVFLKPPSIQERIETSANEDRTGLGHRFTLASWCDRSLGTQILDQINGELIKWCEAFLDEGHATWPMPGREKGFYGAWKFLAGQEWSPCGIGDGRQKLARLPAHPEDALLESLTALGIPSEAWQDYLSLHLAALPGWAGFIKWRADQAEYEWQQVYPADLVQYLAVRLWYEREWVAKTCREEMGIAGEHPAISSYLKRHPYVCFLRQERVAGDLPPRYAQQVDGLLYGWSARRIEAWEALAKGYAAECGPQHDRRARLSAAWRLMALAKTLEVDPAILSNSGSEDLRILLDWLNAFPESQHGPRWLEAFEVGYQEQLFKKLMPNVRKFKEAVSEQAQPSGVRPQAQAVFCIDVRSEPFRRHLERVGNYETLGFAGFFIVFIRYCAFGSHRETEQFPVVMKAKNVVREIPRAYQGQVLSRYRAGAQLVHAGHALLHDLKENVVTPYVMVESLGWFYSLPILGKTLFPIGYRKWTAWLRNRFAPPIATTLTVDKLSKNEAQEMLVSEQRAIIRRALRERLGRHGAHISPERVEELRQRALNEDLAVGPASPRDATRVSSLLESEEEEAAFVEELRRRYRINERWASSRMERITRTGFTLSEQAFTVETALRMMGLTRNFARLVLLCGHGSTSENNPFEAALDCGACGGNQGQANARVLAAFANKQQVRDLLEKNGLCIPQDTYFIAGQVDTTTDEVQLFDLEDVPPTHRKDILRLSHDLQEAGTHNSQERCLLFPEVKTLPPISRAARHVRRRSLDWSQVRPEWGLSGNASFIIASRRLTQGVHLAGRAFLHSYDYCEDPTGRLLEIIMTGPQVVGQWINMEHYFSTVDTNVYGSGSKIYHNVVGRLGIMYGPQSDLRSGLAWQTVMSGERPFHEPMRLLTLIEAPRECIGMIIGRHHVLQHYYDNHWVHLVALEGETFYRYLPKQEWVPLQVDILSS